MLVIDVLGSEGDSEGDGREGSSRAAGRAGCPCDEWCSAQCRETLQWKFAGWILMRRYVNFCAFIFEFERICGVGMASVYESLCLEVASVSKFLRVIEVVIVWSRDRKEGC